MNNYFSKRFQRVRINSQFSPWSGRKNGAPQGSILGPLLFNIDIADLFLCLDDTDIASFADDNTPYALENDINSVILKLEDDAKNLFQWFENNLFKANPDKSHLLLSTSDTSKAAWINGISIPNENHVELLGISIDNAMTFEKHITNLCNKASNKLNALARISSLIDLDKRKLLLRSFFLSQFSYCPLVWMLHSRKLND